MCVCKFCLRACTCAFVCFSTPSMDLCVWTNTSTHLCVFSLKSSFPRTAFCWDASVDRTSLCAWVLRACSRVCLSPPFLCCNAQWDATARAHAGLPHSQPQTERSHNASAFQRLPSREALLLQQGLSYQEVTRPTLSDNSPQCTEAAPIETTHLVGRLMPHICQPANNSPFRFSSIHPLICHPSCLLTKKPAFSFFSPLTDTGSPSCGQRVPMKMRIHVVRIEWERK